ncbi:MAG: PQQ-dependent sugar dehydrogenase [Marinagarivorans sp.]|nr:PQQ-dependent sugar dehydrogenase [Marinagarivorans sp.]
MGNLCSFVRRNTAIVPSVLMKSLLMKSALLASAIVSGVFVVSGCNSNSDGGSQQSASSSSALSVSSLGGSNTSLSLSSGPVTTEAANASNQTPAFIGQTRALEILDDTVFTTAVIADGLNHPWGMAFLPDGRVLVTERSGQLRIVTTQGDVSSPLEGVPSVDARGQGGLLDVSLSPTFSRDRWVYVSYAEARGDGKNGTTVARGKLRLDDTGLDDVEVIFRQAPAWASTLHFGSRLVWDSEGYLFVTLGERSLPASRQLAQDTTTHLGKVVRLNPDGSSPVDNPFVAGGGLPELWSYGHRNIQSAAINPVTDKLWTIEHGPKGGDELNQPQAGKNYGWPIITYGLDYSGAPIGAGITSKEGMEQPVYFWDPVIAPGGMLFYQGDMFSAWKGSLFVASLTPGALVRLVIDNQKVIGEQRILKGLGRIRDVEQAADGALWVITDADNGALIRVYQ